MIQKKWKVTFGVLGIATFFLLWAALNLWTGRAFYPGDVDNDIGARFVSWESYPEEFCLMVSFKLFVGTSLLMLLGNAHWKRWRRGAAERKLGQ